MIRKIKDKPMGYTDVVFSWVPRVIQIKRYDEDGFNLPSETYICWLVYLNRTVTASIRWGYIREYFYEYTLSAEEQ